MLNTSGKSLLFNNYQYLSTIKMVKNKHYNAFVHICVSNPLIQFNQVASSLTDKASNDSKTMIGKCNISFDSFIASASDREVGLK